MSDLSSSRWDTTYQSPNGPVRAIVTFEGNLGRYDLIDGNGQIFETGQLSGVNYFGPPDGNWLINGHWSLGGSSGSFQFNSSGLNTFTGGWLFDPPTPGGGPWNGQLVNGLSSSRWDTNYESPNGPVHAIVTFEGNFGRYDLIDGNGQTVDSGQLSGVNYFGPPNGNWLINGRWSLDGASGTFQFNSSGLNTFTGGWSFDPPTQGGGPWNGQLIPLG